MAALTRLAIEVPRRAPPVASSAPEDAIDPRADTAFATSLALPAPELPPRAGPGPPPICDPELATKAGRTPMGLLATEKAPLDGCNGPSAVAMGGRFDATPRPEPKLPGFNTDERPVPAPLTPLRPARTGKAGKNQRTWSR